MVAVHLFLSETEHVVGGPRMTDHALYTAGIVPCLCSFSSRRCGIIDLIGNVSSCRIQQFRVGLLVVPAIRITDPFILLPDHEAGFDPVPGLFVSGFTFEGKTLHQHGAIREVPAAA